MGIVPVFLVTLITLPSAVHAALHFGSGIGYYDNQYLHYNDKGYYQHFSVDLGLYSDFKQSYIVYLDAHLYTQLSKLTPQITPIIYAGIGGIFVKDEDSHPDNSNNVEDNLGIRFPMGIEFMSSVDISVFAEVVPTYFVSSDNSYETTATLGIRYYFY